MLPSLFWLCLGRRSSRSIEKVPIAVRVASFVWKTLVICYFSSEATGGIYGNLRYTKNRGMSLPAVKSSGWNCRSDGSPKRCNVSIHRETQKRYVFFVCSDCDQRSGHTPSSFWSEPGGQVIMGCDMPGYDVKKIALEVPKTNFQVCVCFFCGARWELCRSSFIFWWKNWGEAHAQVQHYPCWLEAR